MPTPPDAGRVAARALVPAAVACRGLIEKDANKPGAEELRKRVVGWLNAIGVSAELERDEATLLSTPLGELDRKATLNATWRSEGMVVLAWALACTELPPVSIECEPSDVANSMGFLDERQHTPLHDPYLRNCTEIEARADTYLTLHWRLRQFSLEPVPMDLVAYVNACTWASLRLDHLEIVEGDLAIAGVRIDRIPQEACRRTLSITQERHQAFNWLLGFEALYSLVPLDSITDSWIDLQRTEHQCRYGTDHLIALYSTAPPADDSGPGTELVGNGYTRKAFVGGSPQTEADTHTRSISNSNTILFGPCTGADWPTVTHFGVVASDGTVKYTGQLPTPKTVQVGDYAQFDPSSLVVKED